jgi:hypothetical protein
MQIPYLGCDAIPGGGRRSRARGCPGRRVLRSVCRQPGIFGNHTDKVRPLTPKGYVAASRLSRKNFLRLRVNLSTSGWQGWPRQLPPRLPGRAAMDAHPRR